MKRKYELFGGLAAALAATLLFGACDGDNLFTGTGPLSPSGEDQLGPTTTILQPGTGDSYPLTDSLLVRVQATDSGGLAQISIKGIAIRTDPLQNTVVVNRYQERTIPFPQTAGQDAPRDTIVMRYLQPLNPGVSEEVLIIATSVDRAGNQTADTVAIIDGPRIAIVNPADSAVVGTGRTLLVNVRASDPQGGLDSVQLVVGGTVQQVFSVRGLLPRTVLDTTFSVNTGPTEGDLTLNARVWNQNRVMGAGQQVTVQVRTGAAVDTEAPLVARAVTSPTRLELGDSIEVTVEATDGAGSGITRMGIVLTAAADTLGAQHTFYRSTVVFDPPLSGTPERRFYVSLGEEFSETQLRFPRTFTVHVHAFAVDDAGNCGASVSAAMTALPCDTTVVSGVRYHTAANAEGDPLTLTGTAGSSLSIPGGGRIADVAVDAPRQRVYLSNIERNKIEMFDLAAGTFLVTGSSTGLGLVGAAPWGMTIDDTGDTLFVANSGGTNISVVSINPAAADYGRERVQSRILTPNTVLRDFEFQLVDGFLRYSETIHDFSDRPQFIAEHSSGTIVYSTQPTSQAVPGTIRYVDTSGGRAVVRLLHNGYFSPVENTIGVANIDSVRVVRAADGNDEVILYDRQANGTFIASIQASLQVAIADLAASGSDVESVPGAWDIPSIGLQDTTFVAASGDRGTIAFGEGDRAPVGRIFLCCEIETVPFLQLSLSSRPINVADLVNNAAERVFGLGLSQDGTYGVARGGQAAYFFTADRSLTDPLRLQGEFRSGIAGGTGGAALHPGLSNVLEPNADLRLAFVATGNSSIRIIDSVHYFERGEIILRDPVVGPVRAVLPTAAELSAFPAGDPNRMIMKLIAVTEGDNVVIVNVRRKDILN
ncbi:MAG: Ig-like domain-containing protein [Gemmatimonadota bacterium]